METLFDNELKVINMGLEGFAETLKERGTSVLHVRWQPPAMGDDNLLSLLDKLK
ncbi:MAG: fdrA domain protein [Bacillota bacterium]